MAQGVHVDHDALQAQQDQLNTSYGELVGVLDRLRGQITDLVETGFKTESASESFRQAHERWNTAATTCIDELNAMRDYLRGTSQAFAETDQAATIKL